LFVQQSPSPVHICPLCLQPVAAQRLLVQLPEQQFMLSSEQAWPLAVHAGAVAHFPPVHTPEQQVKVVKHVTPLAPQP
jgi:hypothetical protein